MSQVLQVFSLIFMVSFSIGVLPGEVHAKPLGKQIPLDSEKKWSWGNVQQEIAQQISGKPDSARAEVLLAKKDALPSAFLYAAAYHLSKKDQVRAHRIFFLARIRSRYDAQQCLDPTARQGVTVLEMMFGEKFNFVFALNEKKPDLVNKVLLELANDPDTFTYEASPWWICSHGIDVVISELDGKKLESPQWRVSETRRKEIRDEIVASLVKSASE